MEDFGDVDGRWTKLRREEIKGICWQQLRRQITQTLGW